VPVTVSVVLGGCVLWLLLGVSAGILAALRPRSFCGSSVMALAVLGSPRRCSSPAWAGHGHRPGDQLQRPAHDARVVLFAAFFVIMANLLVDLAYAALDPRVRYG
jgi:ABC-type dipeptide/oligopeptide/nickel transport system permease component